VPGHFQDNCPMEGRQKMTTSAGIKMKDLSGTQENWWKGPNGIHGTPYRRTGGVTTSWETTRYWQKRGDVDLRSPSSGFLNCPCACHGNSQLNFSYTIITFSRIPNQEDCLFTTEFCPTKFPA
jgi:hypothetical protein